MTARQWFASWWRPPARPNGDARNYDQDFTPQAEKDKLSARYDLIDREFEKAFGKSPTAEVQK